MDYDRYYFMNYVNKVVNELESRNIKYNRHLFNEILKFCNESGIYIGNYPEHNNRYLKQCYYNLQEKYDRRNNK